MKTLAALRWHVFTTSERLAPAVVEAIRAQSLLAVRERQAFHVVLAGGTTPREVYRRLAELPLDWDLWHVYFGDERCVPVGAPDRNDTMAFDAWLRQVPIPRAQVHTMPADFEAGALESCTRELEEAGTFDLVLLGLGEDGHTASLFPGADIGAGAEDPDLLTVSSAPKPPPRRISMSARRLSRARAVFFLVSGEGKRRALADLRDGADIPAARITSETGVVDVYADESAVAAQQ